MQVQPIRGALNGVGTALQFGDIGGREEKEREVPDLLPLFLLFLHP